MMPSRFAQLALIYERSPMRLVFDAINKREAPGAVDEIRRKFDERLRVAPR